MRRAMADAEVGDDQYGEDPTVNALEEAYAARVGKPAALFVPSGVMANQIALRVLCRPGALVIAGRRQHAQLDAVQLLQGRSRNRLVQGLAAFVDAQDAACLLLVLDAGFGAQRQKLRPAVAADRGDLGRVGAGACRQALTQEGEAPGPLVRIGAQAKQHRRVFAPQPFEHLLRRRWIGPGLGVAGRNLAAVGEAGFHRGRILAVDDRDLMPGAGQIPSAGHADYAGAQDCNFHFFNRAVRQAVK